MSERTERPTPLADERFTEIVRAYQDRRVLLYLAVVRKADDPDVIAAMAGFVGSQSAELLGQVAAGAGQSLGSIIAQTCEMLPPHAAATLMAAMHDANLLSRAKVESGGTVAWTSEPTTSVLDIAALQGAAESVAGVLASCDDDGLSRERAMSLAARLSRALAAAEGRAS